MGSPPPTPQRPPARSLSLCRGRPRLATLATLAHAPLHHSIFHSFSFRVWASDRTPRLPMATRRAGCPRNRAKALGVVARAPQSEVLSPRSAGLTCRAARRLFLLQARRGWCARAARGWWTRRRAPASCSRGPTSWSRGRPTCRASRATGSNKKESLRPRPRAGRPAQGARRTDEVWRLAPRTPRSHAGVGPSLGPPKRGARCFALAPLAGALHRVGAPA